MSWSGKTYYVARRTLPHSDRYLVNEAKWTFGVTAPFTSWDMSRFDLSGMHRNHLAKWRLRPARRSPKHRILGYGGREAAVEVGQDDQRFRSDSVFIEPFETRTKFGSSSADRPERNRFASFVGIDPLHHRVEIHNVYTTGSLSFEDRANLGLEETEQPLVHRARAIHGNHYFPDALSDDPRQIKSGPEMTAVRPHPAVVSRSRVRPELLSSSRQSTAALEASASARARPEGDFPACFANVTAWLTAISHSRA